MIVEGSLNLSYRSVVMLERFMRGAVVAFVMAALLSSSAEAASPGTPTGAPSYALTEGMNEFGIWGGGSPGSNVAIGATPDTSFLVFGLRYGRVLKAWESISLQYTFDIL